MHRDPLETAKSAVRLRYMKDMPPGDPKSEFTTTRQMYNSHMQGVVHEKYFPKSDSVNVYLEELVDNPEKTGDKISGFLNREIDLSRVSIVETFKEAREPQ
jgi:hypothetical protein